MVERTCNNHGSMEACQTLQKVQLKIIVVGDSFVGKSSLVHTYSRDVRDDWGDINSLESTIGLDFAKKEIIVDNYSVMLSLWDTAGQERYHSLIQSYFRGAEGAVAVYDVTNRRTFENIEYWLKMVNQVHPKPVIIIVGNKIDRECRTVSRSEGLEYAKDKGALFMETSVLISQGIGHIFEKLVRKILLNGLPEKRQAQGISLGHSVRPIGLGNCFCR